MKWWILQFRSALGAVPLTDKIKIKKVHSIESLFPILKGLSKRLSDYKPVNPITAEVMPDVEKIKKIYAYSLSTPLESGGRLYCGYSIQSLPKEIRGFLMTHTTDIDMKNCHPVILKYICTFI